MPFTPTPEILAALFLIAFVAGTFDAIAGGGGLITIPALLVAGVSPIEAIATNKLQAVFSTTSSTVAFARRGLIHWPSGLPMALMAFLGSIAGAFSINFVPRSVLEAAVPIMLILIASYFALKRRFSDEDAQAKISPLAFGLTLSPLIGFYDGVFGPGAGSFYMAGFVSLMGYGLLRATAHTKLANAGSNWGGLLIFMLSGHIIWMVGLIMGAGSLLGAQVGSRLAMRLGVRLIRPLLVTICFALAGRLLLNPENPVRTLLAQIW